MPSLEDFFEEAIEQADPANMVEDQYKYTHSFISLSFPLPAFALSIFRSGEFLTEGDVIILLTYSVCSGW